MTETAVFIGGSQDGRTSEYLDAYPAVEISVTFEGTPVLAERYELDGADPLGRWRYVFVKPGATL